MTAKRGFILRIGGFTLIELIVVITIIGIMSGVGALAYQKSVRQSRDERRKVDLESIRSALELYRSNQVNGNYPMATTALAPAYITLPTDPLTAVAYPYSRIPPTCNNTAPNFCTGYVMQITLEDTASMYRVGQHGVLPCVPEICSDFIDNDCDSVVDEAACT